MERGPAREVVALVTSGRLTRREAVARLAMLGVGSSAITSALETGWIAAAPRAVRTRR